MDESSRSSRPSKKGISEDDEDEEEGGRSSLGRSKRKPVVVLPEQEHLSLSEEVDLPTTKPAKRPHSFLDVMLAQKSQKRRRHDQDKEGLTSGS